MRERTFSRGFKGRSNKKSSWANIESIIDGIWGMAAFSPSSSRDRLATRAPMYIDWIDSEGAHVKTERLEELRHEFENGKVRRFSIGHIMLDTAVPGLKFCSFDWSCEEVAEIDVEASNLELIERAIAAVRSVFPEELEGTFKPRLR
jgi:hypothetical protein